MAEPAKFERLPPGRRVGKYEIVAHLADGGMAAVYKAVDTDLGRIVALKILPRELAAKPHMIDRFRREARAAAGLQHKNIVAIYDVGEADGLNYLAMEFVNGITVEKYMQRRGRIPPEEARQILLQVARALDHAYHANIVHRDIKPSNLLMAVKDRRLLVKLADLGLAIHLENEDDFRVTKMGMTVGTVDYMAPEQARNSTAVDTRSDIYALGCTLFHMLGGIAPFPRGSLTERLIQHLEKPPPDVRQLNRDVPEGLSNILAKMLAKKPEDRFQTPSALLKALEQLGPLPAATTTATTTPTKSGSSAETPALPALDPDEDDFASLLPPTPTPPPRKSGPFLKSVERADAPPADLQPLLDTAADAPMAGSKTPVEAVEDMLPLIDMDVPTATDPVTAKEAEHSQRKPRSLKAPRRPAEASEPSEPSEPSEVKPIFAEAAKEPAAPPRPPREVPPRAVPPPRRPLPAVEEPVAAPQAAEQPDATSDEEFATAASSSSETLAGWKWEMPVVPWWVYTIGGGVLLVLLLPLLATLLPTRQPVVPVDPIIVPPVVVVPDGKSEESPVIVAPKKNPDEKPHVEGPIETDAAKMSAGTWPTQTLRVPFGSASSKASRADLRRAVLGPFATAPPLTPTAVVKLSRTMPLGAGNARTLADALALAKADATTAIEIHDQGPIYLPSQPAIEGKRIVLRAGSGFRPLLAWEPSAAPLLSVSNGTLALEGLDIVARIVEGHDDTPSVLFDLRGSDFAARDCTFSVIDKTAAGSTVVRLRGADGAAPLLCRFSGCFVRGPNLSAVCVEATSAQLLLQRSLVVGQRQPLLRIRGRIADAVSVRLDRSTLVAGDNLLEWNMLDGKGGAPRLHGHTLDCVLARNDVGGSHGNLLHLADGNDNLVSWHAVNTVYTGWRHLLAPVGIGSIDGTDLNAWQSRWIRRDGESAQADTWPNAPTAQLAELPATTFAVHDSSLAFAARGSGGAVGCPMGVLPPEPFDWMARTYEPRAAIAVEGTPTSGIPTLPPPGNDGLYRGERIDFAKNHVDLGQYLQTKLVPGRCARRVVLHLAGSGKVATSPLRVRGVERLVIYVEPANDPLTLEVDARSVASRPALIEVEQGSLELIGMHVKCVNSRSAIVPPHLLRVQGGDLYLTQCRLVGPLGQAPNGFQGLIDFTPPPPSAEPNERPALVSLRDSVLLSGQSLVTLRGPHVQVVARQCVGLALGPALQVEMAGPVHPDVTVILDRDTWALRQGFLALRGDWPGVHTAPAVLVQVADNYFAAPFDPAASPGPFVSAAADLLPRGILLWRGRYNAFDLRLAPYFGTPGVEAGKQTLDDWVRIWGQSDEKRPTAVEPPAKTPPLSLDAPALERLALPPGVRRVPGRAPAGADLGLLGLSRKG